MDTAFYNIVLVGVIVAAGLIFIFVTISKRESQRKLQFERLLKELFPGCYLKHVSQARGGFSAEMHSGGKIFVFVGDYIAEEGGDGYMHVYEGVPFRNGKELFTVPLAVADHHWAVLEHGAKRLSEHLKNENRA